MGERATLHQPDWETGKAVRWRISQPGDVPMGIAGIYRRWRNPEGEKLCTFAMIAVNADGHPVMQRFHKPSEEKRMVVVLDLANHMAWLTCSVEQAPTFFRQWMGALDAVAAPLARASRAAPALPPQDELF